MTDKYTVAKDGRVMRDGRPTGWRVERGAYQGTTNDRLDRWYLYHDTRRVIDRRGSGFATRREAAEEVRYLAAMWAGET